MAETQRRTRNRAAPFDPAKLKALRESRFLSMPELSRRTEMYGKGGKPAVSRPMIEALEKGRCGASHNTVRILAEVLDCRVSDLMPG